MSSPPSPAEPNNPKSAHRKKRIRKFAFGALALVLVVASAIAADWWIALPPGLTAEYTGGDSCVRCHEQEANLWKGSDHDWAMDYPNEKTVLGNFDNQTLEHHGMTTRMFREGDKYFMETEGPDGKRGVFPVTYTFGVRPLQQYLSELPGGHVQVMPATWDTEKKEWYFANPDEPFGPGDPLHWTGSAQNWNHMCADCHSTDFRKNYDIKTKTHNYTYADMDVGCEACHGPGSIHIQLADAKSLFWDRRYGYGLAKLKTESSKPQLDTCAPCHSHRRVIKPGYLAGEEYLDYFDLTLLREHLYYPDGQIKEEVYVYGSFLQSKMYRKGVRCSDCHDPHSMKIKFEGNRLCGQCHLPAKYDTPSHHHHKIDDKGALCVECHMPTQNYMVVDPRLDHSIRVPRPDLSLKIGTLNACTQNCHNEKPEEDDRWAADKIVEWYGPKRAQDPHYGEIFYAAHQRDPDAVKGLIRVAHDREVGPIVRATAISLLATHYDQGADRSKALDQALTSSEAVVRAAAVQAYETVTFSSAEDVRAFKKDLVDLLFDPIRLVRVEAARLLAQVPSRYFDSKEQEALTKALDEYEAGQYYHADQPGSHMNLAILYDRMNRENEAIEQYGTAIDLDPEVAGPRSNLSELLSRLGKEEQAQELRRQEEKLLARDVKLMPDNAPLHYRLGLLEYLLGKEAEAEKSLQQAVAREPRTGQYLLTLALLYDKQQRWDLALPLVDRLLRLEPENAMYRQLRGEMLQKQQQKKVIGPALPGG